MRAFRIFIILALVLSQTPLSLAFADSMPQMDAILKTREALFSSVVEENADTSKIEKINSLLSIENGLLTGQKIQKGTLSIEAPAQTFRLEKVLFSGNKSIPSAELEKLTTSYLRRPIFMEDVQALVSEVKRYYRSKGFVASYAYLGEQVLENNAITISVIEGQLGEMTITGNKHVSEQVIRQQFSVKPGDTVNYQNFSGDLERLNKHRDIEAKAQLKPGATNGSTDIDLKIKDKQPVHMSLDANNLGTRDTGKYRIGAGLADSNVSGRLDEASTRFEFGSGSYAMMADYNTPVLPDDTRVGLQASYASNAVGGSFSSLNIEGDATDVGVYATHPIVRKSDFSADLRAGFDVKNVENKILGIVAGEDDLRILSGGFQLEKKTPTYKWLGSQMFYKGIDGFGSTKNIEEEGFGLDTRTNFFAYRGAFTLHKPLWHEIFGLWRVVAQASPNHLPSSEQMRMGGAYSVRGYNENEYSADYGIFSNVEVYVPFDKPYPMIPLNWRLPYAQMPLAKQMQWVFFLDAGHGGINDPFIGETAEREFMGAGGGVRIQLYDKVYLRMDVGVPISGLGGAEPNKNDLKSVFYFGISSELF